MTDRYKGQEHVYAVVRWDRFHRPDAAPEMLITVKEIVRTPELAEAEVERLNALNGHKDVIYFWQTTRLYPEGRSSDTDVT